MALSKREQQLLAVLQFQQKLRAHTQKLEDMPTDYLSEAEVNVLSRVESLMHDADGLLASFE